MATPYNNPRVNSSQHSNAQHGEVYWSATKSLWVTTQLLIFAIAGPMTMTLSSLLVFLLFTAFTLCFGHSLGMHRLFIHRSYRTPKWLEYFLVHLGVVVGLAGPFGMMRTHDIRDWAQRQKNCHDYFGHQQPFLRDGFWQIHCDIKLNHPPKIVIESHYYDDAIYQWMEKYWMWQQLPWALLFLSVGGISWVVWGICARVVVSVTGHWLIGYFAHNQGGRHYHVEGAAIQGYNIPFTALITMGENWHNNHHAFPSSAKLGIHDNEWDPGWWMLKIMKRLGLVSNVVLPDNIPQRSDLTKIDTAKT
jgi:stearoyl-CoA desaturase (delta-9 desaturase)